jgi:hypothetical protein
VTENLGLDEDAGVTGNPAGLGFDYGVKVSPVWIRNPRHPAGCKAEQLLNKRPVGEALYFPAVSTRGELPSIFEAAIRQRLQAKLAAGNPADDLNLWKCVALNLH